MVADQEFVEEFKDSYDNEEYDFMGKNNEAINSRLYT